MNRFPYSFLLGMPQGWIRKLENNKILFDFSKIEYFPILIYFFSDEEIKESNISIETFKKIYQKY